MTTLKDKVVWITGASSGIGEALAVEAAARGAKLVLSARRDAELRRVRDRCTDPSRVAILALDLLDFDAPLATQTAAGFFGPIDILVNNAGKTQRGAVIDTQLSVYRQILELDLIAPMALTKAVLPAMRARGSGHIVMIGSIISRIGTPMRSGYAAAKHALAGFTEAAAAELWRDGIRFTLVCPGYVRTEVSINALNGDGQLHGLMDPNTDRGMTAAYCANRIWNAVQKNRAELLIGVLESTAVYVKRFAPWLVARVLRRANVQ